MKEEDLIGIEELARSVKLKNKGISIICTDLMYDLPDK